MFSLDDTVKTIYNVHITFKHAHKCITVLITINNFLLRDYSKLIITYYKLAIPICQMLDLNVEFYGNLKSKEEN